VELGMEQYTNNNAEMFEGVALKREEGALI